MEFQKSYNYPKFKFGAKCTNNCICDRKRENVIVCSRCKQTFVGRISQRCPKHPEVTFLMDARQCAFCGAHANFLQISETSEKYQVPRKPSGFR
ncbi:uncharacterized protein CG13380 [Drosophila yakuba]|uniref:Uncharacterized protein n=1 Tax=Drosophila yakuba TaxID=7245 RepID=A0A0R1DY00_DROYA|nr:uncharacterized protein CG13380 [Drosophila yakuba]KRK01948.1 uncharacterized protein Dyak_GE27966 [Drosophila yakuba]